MFSNESINKSFKLKLKWKFSPEKSPKSSLHDPKPFNWENSLWLLQNWIENQLYISFKPILPNYLYSRHKPDRCPVAHWLRHWPRFYWVQRQAIFELFVLCNQSRASSVRELMERCMYEASNSCQSILRLFLAFQVKVKNGVRSNSLSWVVFFLLPFFDRAQFRVDYWLLS